MPAACLRPNSTSGSGKAWTWRRSWWRSHATVGGRNLGVSTADAIAAVSHAQRLAQLRGHQQLSREDLLDGIRSTFIKGADESEGVPVLALARKRLAGDRTGNVPAEAGQPPIVLDFRTTAQRLKLKLDTLNETEAVLDLYRKSNHRDISRLFHRLTFLDIPFATFDRGPDFVAGENLDRIQEVWSYSWSPRTESSLIERSLYGSTVEEAASNLLLERFAEAEQRGQGGHASFATQLVLHACRMGLHRHTQELLSRVGSLIAVDPALDSLVAAMEDLLMLEVSREPLEGASSGRPARTGNHGLPPGLLRDSFPGCHAAGGRSTHARGAQWPGPSGSLAG